jgi:transcriptional regulator with XRE-family HTH domain
MCPHPAKAVLALRRITNRAIAQHLGVSAHYVGRVLNGYVKPSARVRAGLAEYLQVPVAELFRDSTQDLGAR